MARAATIARILSARVETYRDSGQTIATVAWIDTRGQRGVTTGPPTNPHMAALIARAAREN